MDKKLQLLLSLYDDSEVVDEGIRSSKSAPETFPGQSLDTEFASSTPNPDELQPLEIRRLSEAKFVMENRARFRPDASVIDSIVLQASSRVPQSSASSSSPLRLIKGLTTGVFPVRYAVAASVVLFAVVIGISRLGGLDEIGAVLKKDAILTDGDASAGNASASSASGGTASGRTASDKKASADNAFTDNASADSPSAEKAFAEKDSDEQRTISADKLEANFASELDDAAPAESKVGRVDALREAEEVAPAAGRRDLAASPVRQEFAQAAAAAKGGDFRGVSDSLTGWDDGTRMRVLQRRIESLRGNNADLAWDQPAVPLEQLVRVPTQPGLLRAKSKQN